MRFEDPVASLDRAIPAAWKAGADVVLLLAHECHDRVAPMVRAHPEWDLSFAGTGHCHRTSVEVIDGTLVVGPDWRLEHYARVQLRIDSSKPQRERASLLDYELVDVASKIDQPQPSVDAALDEKVAGWRREVLAALGEQIGYSQVGLGKKSNAIGQWIARAWLDHFKVDLAISTQGAIRQELPPGKITKATVASIMPFENELVVCELHGKDLDAMLREPEAIVAGFSKSGDSWVDAEGKPIEPERTYRVVTSDFLFFGGDGFTMHRHDHTPKMTGVNWRTPVIEWTKRRKTSQQQPLESVLRQPATPGTSGTKGR
jgi:5'-nucleotidase/UDP-sugar diphosphatase